MVIDLDLVDMTATLRNSYSKPQQWRSESQGSMQQLSENGNMFVGWGSAAAYTEFAANGEILCDVHFGAESVFAFGRVGSYRAFKSEWIGKPLTPPGIKMIDDDVYVSWNGATEVVSWELQGSKALTDEDQDFVEIDWVQKEGFETTLQLPDDRDAYIYLRAAALDGKGKALGYTDVIERRTGQSATRPPQPEDQRYSISIWLLIAGCALISVGLSIRLLWRPLSAVIQLHRWRGYRRLSPSKHWWSSGRATDPTLYLADVSASSSETAVAHPGRPAP